MYFLQYRFQGFLRRCAFDESNGEEMGRDTKISLRFTCGLTGKDYGSPVEVNMWNIWS